MELSTALLLVLFVAVLSGAFVWALWLQARDVDHAFRLIEQLDAKIDRTKPAQLAQELEDLKTEWKTAEQRYASTFGKIWQRLPAVEKAPPKAIDRNELRRQHLPKPQ